MNNMKINRLKIVNYKLFQNVTIEMNENINIFVGENDSGKSTILEALSMVLTGKINGSSVANRLIAIFKIKAHIRRSGTSRNNQRQSQSEKHSESHLEEHPASLL